MHILHDLKIKSPCAKMRRMSDNTPIKSAVPENTAIQQACIALAQGKIIAYPTESVYGLGCDATNEAAVITLQKLKQRRPQQGFIILVSSLQQAIDYTIHSQHHNLNAVATNWPGPYTYVVTASESCPTWLQQQGKIALRISAHPVCQQLTAHFAKGIISTSANLTGQTPLNSPKQIQQQFAEVAYIINAKPGGLAPTSIIDITTATVLR